MPLTGFIWATIICIPFWLIVILPVATGIVSLNTIIILVLPILGLPLFLLMCYKQETKFLFPCYAVKHIGESKWHTVSEIRAMEILVDHFDSITPTLSKLLMGEEILVSNQVVRLQSSNRHACM